MNEQQKELLEQQRKSWDHYSSGWKKWDMILMGIMRPVSNKLIEALQIKGIESVLDVASGTGEPGISLSPLLHEGQVTGTDLSENMVNVANEHAKLRGITNYQSMVSDAANLPFEDNTFDHVISRFGIMFFPDIIASLKEMARVLKPGGKMVIAVWAAPDRNPFLTLMSKTIAERLGLPEPPPDAPTVFRCAMPGFTTHLMREAGMEHVSETVIQGVATFDSPEQYWDVFFDVAGPIVQALNNAPEELVNDIKNEVLRKAENFMREGRIFTDWEAIIVSGTKK